MTPMQRGTILYHFPHNNITWVPEIQSLCNLTSTEGESITDAEVHLVNGTTIKGFDSVRPALSFSFSPGQSERCPLCFPDPGRYWLSEIFPILSGLP